MAPQLIDFNEQKCGSNIVNFTDIELKFGRVAESHPQHVRERGILHKCHDFKHIYFKVLTETTAPLNMKKVAGDMHSCNTNRLGNHDLPFQV